MDYEVKQQDLTWYYAPDVNDVLAFGQDRGWTIKQIEGEGTLKEPVVHNGMIYIPREVDSSKIPEYAQERLTELQAYFPIQQVLIGHELVSPGVRTVFRPQVRFIAAAIAILAAVLMLSFTMATVAPVLLLLLAATGVAVAVDPQLIVVTETGEWICIAAWYE